MTAQLYYWHNLTGRPAGAFIHFQKFIYEAE